MFRLLLPEVFADRLVARLVTVLLGAQRALLL